MVFHPKKADKQAYYRRLYETYEHDLFSYGSAFGLSKEELEDAIHDVFLHLYERDSELGGDGNAKFYLLNCLKNRIRMQKRREQPTECIEEGREEHNFLIVVNDFELIEEEHEKSQLVNRLQRMLDALTDRQREAIYLRYTQGLTYEEIGKIMLIQPTAAQKLVYRAISEMQKMSFISIYLLLLWLQTSYLSRG